MWTRLTSGGRAAARLRNGRLIDRLRLGTIAPDVGATTALPFPTPRPIHQLPHHQDQFGGLEGFGEEGVDADVKPGLDLVLGAGTDDGEGQMTGQRIGPQPSGGPEPVQPGHDDVEGHNIGPHLMNDIKTLGTIGRGHDLQPLQLEVDPDQLPDDLVVVHNKHPTRRAWHNSRVGRPRPPRPGFPHFHPARATHTPALDSGNPLMTTLRELVVFYPSPRAIATDTPP